ncbi:hypothetical protein G9A89_004568 [Geosiphon pyriformis]|nr:hypothetical protein G9A89_004568 [Geosiphon pyriformis]
MPQNASLFDYRAFLPGSFHIVHDINDRHHNKISKKTMTIRGISVFNLGNIVCTRVASATRDPSLWLKMKLIEGYPHCAIIYLKIIVIDDTAGGEYLCNWR